MKRFIFIFSLTCLSISWKISYGAYKLGEGSVFMSSVSYTNTAEKARKINNACICMINNLHLSNTLLHTAPDAKITDIETFLSYVETHPAHCDESWATDGFTYSRDPSSNLQVYTLDSALTDWAFDGYSIKTTASISKSNPASGEIVGAHLLDFDIRFYDEADIETSIDRPTAKLIEDACSYIIYTD